MENMYRIEIMEITDETHNDLRHDEVINQTVLKHSMGTKFGNTERDIINELASKLEYDLGADPIIRSVIKEPSPELDYWTITIIRPIRNILVNLKVIKLK